MSGTLEDKLIDRLVELAAEAQRANALAREVGRLTSDALGLELKLTAAKMMTDSLSKENKQMGVCLRALKDAAEEVCDYMDQNYGPRSARKTELKGKLIAALLNARRHADVPF